MNSNFYLKSIYLVIFLSLFINCEKKQEISSEKLNGYWEIQKVIKDGEEKDYGFNPVIEYFEIKNNKGIRKKVYPKLDGKYQTDILADSVRIISKNKKYYLEIKNNTWKTQETIIILNDSVLQYTTENNIEFKYKRHQKIEL